MYRKVHISPKRNIDFLSVTRFTMAVRMPRMLRDWVKFSQTRSVRRAKRDSLTGSRSEGVSLSFRDYGNNAGISLYCEEFVRENCRPDLRFNSQEKVGGGSGGLTKPLIIAGEGFPRFRIVVRPRLN